MSTPLYVVTWRVDYQILCPHQWITKYDNERTEVVDHSFTFHLTLPNRQAFLNGSNKFKWWLCFFPVQVCLEEVCRTWIACSLPQLSSNMTAAVQLTFRVWMHNIRAIKDISLPMSLNSSVEIHFGGQAGRLHWNIDSTQASSGRYCATQGLPWISVSLSQRLALVQ